MVKIRDVNEENFAKRQRCSKLIKITEETLTGCKIILGAFTDPIFLVRPKRCESQSYPIQYFQKTIT